MACCNAASIPESFQLFLRNDDDMIADIYDLISVFFKVITVPGM